MTKKLEEFFNLASSDEETTEETKRTIEENKEIIHEIDEAIDKIDNALPGVRNLDTADAELDELADLAKDNFNELVNLAMNVDPRFSGVILQSASTLLGHAISAKTAKIDKKLKTVNLQLAKAKLDLQIEKNNASKVTEDGAETAIDGQGIVLDRNALLNQILGKKPE